MKVQMAIVRAALGAALGVSAGVGHAALVTYNFTASQTSTIGDDPSKTGIVDTLRSVTAITGSITFDTTLQLAQATGEVYGKASIRIDGADTSSANSRALTSFVQDRPSDDVISTGYQGSLPGTPETYDVFIFTGIDQNNGLHDADTAFPALLPPPGFKTTYTLDLRTASWDGTRFGPLEQVIYRLNSLTLDEPGVVPAPATGWLVLAGLGALGRTRRRGPPLSLP